MHLEITGEVQQMKHGYLKHFGVHEVYSCTCVFFTVIKLDGSTPVRYGLRLNMDEKYTGLKKQLSELCSLKPEQILLAEVHSSNIKVSYTHCQQALWTMVNFTLCSVYCISKMSNDDPGCDSNQRFILMQSL